MAKRRNPSQQNLLNYAKHVGEQNRSEHTSIAQCVQAQDCQFMPPDTQPTSNTKTKRKRERCGTGSLLIQKPSDYANCIGTPTANTAQVTDAPGAKARQASKSTPPTTTQAPIKATQIGCTLKWQSNPQKHLKQPGEHCQSHKNARRNFPLRARPRNHLCFPHWFRGRIRHLDPSLCYNIQTPMRRETAMTDTQFIYSFIMGWVSCWLFMKMMANRT